MEKKFEIPDIKHAFKVPRRNDKGRFERNAQEEIIYDEYVYDFDHLGIDRILAGRQLFSISNKQYTVNQPRNTDELTALVGREADRQALAAILMKKIGENEFEDYKKGYNLSAFLAMPDIKGKENWNKIQECMSHFFLQVGLQLPELMSQSLDIMNESVNILKAMNEIKEATGLDLATLTNLTKEGNTSTETPTKSKKNSTV